MTLLDFIHILSRRKWVIILTAFFTLLVFALVVFNTPPKYTATSSVRVLTTRSGSADYIVYNVDYSTRVMNTYKELATSAPILEELGRYVSPVPELEVVLIPDSELIKISATDIDPALAQFAANKLGNIIVQQSQINTSTNELPVIAYVAETASLPEIPSSPSPYLLIALGLAVGLIGGLALAFVFESLDTRLYTVNQIETETNLLTIGNIPDFNGQNGNQQLYIFDRQVGAESFRRLSANILSIMRDKGMKSFLISSPVPRDGRSSIVANLAITLAQTNRKILVIDADMRNPVMHEIFGITNTNGLSRLLTLRQDALKCIYATGFEGVNLLTAGPRPANPIETLDTPEMQSLIHFLEKHYDLILLDTPACLSFTDAVVAGSSVGGIILVVRMSWVRREVLQNTLIQLRNANSNLVGLVVNRTKIGSGIKKKTAIQPEKNGSAPRGKERDLRKPSLPERKFKEPKTMDSQKVKPAPSSIDRQPKPAQPTPASPEKDMRIPRPPREYVMPESMVNGEPEYIRQEIQKNSIKEPIARIGEDLPRESAGDVRGHNTQERVISEPDIRERVVRQPAIRERELSDHGVTENDLRKRIVRTAERRQHVPYERDLDYERYLRKRDLYLRDPRQPLLSEQEPGEGMQISLDNLDHDLRDRSRRERDNRYSSLNDLDINGIDDYPSPPRGSRSR